MSTYIISADNLGVAKIVDLFSVESEQSQKSTGENMKNKIKVDIYQIVRDFGGLTATSRKLKAFGNDISPNGVDKWRQTNSIPAKHLFALAVIARMDKKHFDLVDYTNVEEIRNETV